MEYLKQIENFILSNWDKIVIFVLITIVGLFIIRGTDKTLNKFLIKRRFDPILVNFINGLIKIILSMVLALVLLDYLTIPITPFLTILGTFGLTLALSLKDSISNVASGMIIIVTHPFKQGDYIDCQGIAGTVQKISLINTTLISIDNKKVVMPNNKLTSNSIINFSSEEKRMVEFTFTVAYGTEIEKVKNTIKEVILREEKIYDQPEPIIRLNKLGESGIDFLVRIWCKTTDWRGVYFNMLELVYQEFYKKGISFPFNQLDVHIKSKIN